MPMLKPESKCPFMRLACFLMLTLPQTVAGFATSPAALSRAATTRARAAAPDALCREVRAAAAARAAAGSTPSSPRRAAARPSWAPPSRAALAAARCAPDALSMNEALASASDYRYASGAMPASSAYGAATQQLDECVVGADLPPVDGRVLVLGAGWVVSPNSYNRGHLSGSNSSHPPPPRPPLCLVCTLSS